MENNKQGQHNHAPLFPIALVEKDFRNTLQTAQAIDVSIPKAAAVHDVYVDAIAKGIGSDNITGVSQLYEL